MQIDESEMPDLLIELVTASLFLNPEPFSAPVQPLIAFLRFLHTFANTHWHTTPIILNFNHLLSRNYYLPLVLYYFIGFFYDNKIGDTL
jgi:hypothetical protein